MHSIPEGSSSPAAARPPAAPAELRVLLACGAGPDVARMLQELPRTGLNIASRQAGNRGDFDRELDSFSPDLILADHQPGRFGGLEVLDLLHSRGLEVPVIVVAGAHSEEAAVECLHHGAEDYMSTASLARLPSAVLNAMKRRGAERRKKEVEQEIERLAAFPRHNPNPILAFGADGTLVYFNQAALAMAERLRRAHPRDILPLNVVAVVKMCLATDQNNLRLENSLGGRTLSWSFYPIAAIQQVHCYAEDITERLELETRLRQSQKMESVGQLAAGVAHDFNNILTIIQGHSGLLMASQGLAPALADSIKQIGQAAERAANLTRQLLMFSRKQLAQRRLMDLNEAIKESGGMMRVLTGESIQVQLSCAPSLPSIYADSGMIQQILINLAANARDAMPKGGRLQIGSAAVEVAESECLRNPDAQPGRFVCLSVTDTGCGMEASTLERLFEPFFTTKAPGLGTGLGLATVYGIVKQHQGWIDVASEPGRGTTFRVFFPAASKAQDPEADSGAGTVRGGHETILVVEDEAPLRELVLEILQQYGYKTLEAGDGVEAFKIWSAQRGRIDLVLTDVMMPNGVSGRDLAEKIQAIDPRVKIIFTSGYPMDVLGPASAFKEGFVFLQKPYQPQLLVRTVRDCLDA